MPHLPSSTSPRRWRTPSTSLKPHRQGRVVPRRRLRQLRLVQGSQQATPRPSSRKTRTRDRARPAFARPRKDLRLARLTTLPPRYERSGGGAGIRFRHQTGNRGSRPRARRFRNSGTHGGKSLPGHEVLVLPLRRQLLSGRRHHLFEDTPPGPESRALPVRRQTQYAVSPSDTTAGIRSARCRRWSFADSGRERVVPAEEFFAARPNITRMTCVLEGLTKCSLAVRYPKKWAARSTNA